MSARKSSHGTIFLIVSNGSPLALIASSLRSTSKKPVCPMTRSLHPPMAHCGQRVRFVATWREEFFKVPYNRTLKENVPTFLKESLYRKCPSVRARSLYRKCPNVRFNHALIHVLHAWLEQRGTAREEQNEGRLGRIRADEGRV